jgi:hypothetical protein
VPHGVVVHPCSQLEEASGFMRLVVNLRPAAWSWVESPPALSHKAIISSAICSPAAYRPTSLPVEADLATEVKREVTHHLATYHRGRADHARQAASRHADRSSSLTATGRDLRNPNPFNTLRRVWTSASFALCCGLHRVGRDLLVGLR